jgi:hypothetical protein
MAASSFDFPQSETLPSSYCQSPGTYHVIVKDIQDRPLIKGQVKQALMITTEVLAGTVPDEMGKELRLFLYYPNLTWKDGGEFAKVKIYRFFKACGLADRKQLGDTNIEIDLQKAIGRHIVVAVQKGMTKDGQPSQYLQVSGADIWHVDHEDVEGIPKDQRLLDALDPSMRLIGGTPMPPPPPGPAEDEELSIDDVLS